MHIWLLKAVGLTRECIKLQTCSCEDDTLSTTVEQNKLPWYTHTRVSSYASVKPDSPPIGEQQEQRQSGHRLENGPVAAQDGNTRQQQLCKHGKEAADHGNHETMGRVAELQP